MKKFLLGALALLFSLSALGEKTLTMRDITGYKFYAKRLNGVRALADGASYARISDDGKSIVRYDFKTAKETGIIFNAAEAKGATIRRIDGYVMSPDESRILIQTETEGIYRRSKKAEYYIYTVQNKTLEQLSKNGKQQEPLFSPDGNIIAFVRDNNLFLVKLLFNNAESQVTKDGKFNEVLNGIPDWVNEEELTLSRNFDFSADSKMLAWVRYDESKVPMFNMAMYQGASPQYKQYAVYPGAYSYKYPVAGEQNSTVTVHSFDIKSKVTRQIDVPLDADGYIPRIQFTANPDQLAVVTLNRHQSVMNIYMCNPRSGVCKEVLSEKNDKYVAEAAYENLTFVGQNFILTSDRSGYKQLYWYSLTGQLIKQVTSGTNDVTAFYGYDAATGSFYYQAKDGSALRTAIYCSTLKGKTTKLSEKAGSNSAIFSGNKRYYINVFSNLTTPPVTAICNNQGKTEKVLISNDELQANLKTVNIAQKEFFTFRTSEGVELNGWMMKPVDFDPNKKYPVIMHQYSGPGSQSVQDDWGAGFYGGGLFESVMCEKGYIMACVDGRGTGGRGADFEKCTYLRLGYLEARDQVETAIYLGSLPYVDKENIAIWGWSFGGFMTLMSMSEGRPVFKCGVAIAAPTSWRYYDTIYTERYMRTPQENPEGYDDCPIARAKNLHGDLLLCHGLADDNVHFRNAAEYSEALVQADKQFDMQLYTNRNHSIYGGNTRNHLVTRIVNFFDKHLK